MKQRTIIFLTLIVTFSSTYSQSKIPALDKSEMDISYCPPNYPILKIQDKVTEPPVARVVYSRPQRNGRTVFGELVEYEKVWRIGANEATEIEFFKDVSFGGKPVPKGRYTLYTIPTPDKWIVIINKETDTWGSFKYDSKKDILRIESPVQKLDEPVESLAIYFDKTAAGFNLCAAWENSAMYVPVTESPAVKTSAKPLKKKA